MLFTQTSNYLIPKIIYYSLNVNDAEKVTWSLNNKTGVITIQYE